MSAPHVTSHPSAAPSAARSLGRWRLRGQSERQTIRCWMDLLAAAEIAIQQADPSDPCAQRNASRRLDSLLRYEHQMTPQARRLAREMVWRWDHPGETLPAALHSSDGAPPDPCCVCATCRIRWEQCQCRACRYLRQTGRRSAISG
jgi:hypothetical protein